MHFRTVVPTSRMGWAGGTFLISLPYQTPSPLKVRVPFLVPRRQVRPDPGAGDGEMFPERIHV